MKRTEALLSATPSTSSLDLLESSMSSDSLAKHYFEHSTAKRVNTDAYIFQTLKELYPSAHITVVPEGTCNLLAYAASGKALVLPTKDTVALKWKVYQPPFKRLDGGEGRLADRVLYEEYQYACGDHEFHVYLIDGRDGGSAYPTVRNQYIIGDEEAIDELLLSIGRWTTELHDEIWVFNQGSWRKDADLYKSIQKASWGDVILDDDKKRAVISDIERFFDSRQTYQELRVPWKRGLIFYGPPGNGKTISIKAMSHSLYSREKPVPTLYVRTLTSYGGPEYSLGLIFGKARQEAPCLLVFEDLDSIVTDQVRSFFLNEVDGLSNNDGIMILGSTNHLDRLDPGISKRPSRFDRKYLYDDPTEQERVKYCDFWKRKLRGNQEIEFPQKLCKAIAKITYGFSFAYIQEAFVAALLDIASHSEPTETMRTLGYGQSFRDTMTAIQGPESDNAKDDDLEENLLWQAIQRQVKILREALGDQSGQSAISSLESISKRNTLPSDKITTRKGSADHFDVLIVASLFAVCLIVLIVRVTMPIS